MAIHTFEWYAIHCWSNCFAFFLSIHLWGYLFFSQWFPDLLNSGYAKPLIWYLKSKNKGKNNVMYIIPGWLDFKYSCNFQRGYLHGYCLILSCLYPTSWNGVYICDACRKNIEHHFNRLNKANIKITQSLMIYLPHTTVRFI